MSRNVTLETVIAIEEALEKEFKHFDITEERDRAKLAWWINQNFVEGDLAEKAKKRDNIKPMAPVKG